MYTYTTKGVCARELSFEIDNNIVKSVSFDGGCNGNLKGICALVEGMPVEDVIDRLRGINCGFKGTSCPDQLARALEEYLQDK